MPKFIFNLCGAETGSDGIDITVEANGLRDALATFLDKTGQTADLEEQVNRADWIMVRPEWMITEKDIKR